MAPKGALRVKKPLYHKYYTFSYYIKSYPIRDFTSLGVNYSYA